MKRLIRICRAALPVLIVMSLFGAVSVYAGEADLPKNIILFIGDGMGVSQITAGKIVKGKLNLEQCRVTGLLTTYSQTALVTDSAAAGTALSTGHKTYNDAVAVSLDQKPLKTIVEYAEEHQKTTGLVVTCSVTHATPATFLAHVDTRKKETLVAEHIARSGIDVLFGGGLSYFIPKSTPGSKRDDEKNLLAELEKRMTVVRSAEEFEKLGDVDSVAGFFAPGHLPRTQERVPSLPALTRKAIDILSKNDSGFFLMVEGSQIDWGGHQNDQEFVISEVMDFDDAVGVGLDFAKRDRRTLVVVTADHETGGFAIHDGSVKDRKISESKFTKDYHTAAMVPVFAYGPGSSAFAGIGDSTVVSRTLIGYVRASE